MKLERDKVDKDTYGRPATDDDEVEEFLLLGFGAVGLRGL